MIEIPSIRAGRPHEQSKHPHRQLPQYNCPDFLQLATTLSVAHCPMVCTREHLLLIFGFCVWYPGFKKSLEKKLINFPGFLYFPCFVKRLPWFGACGDPPEIDCLFSCSSCWRSARRKVSTDCTLRAFSSPSHRRCCARFSQNIFSNTTFTFLAIVDCLFFSLLLSP